MFGLKPLLGLEPMAPIRPQLLVSHANHSATETCMYMFVCIMYVCVNVHFDKFDVNCIFVFCLCMYVHVY